MQIHIDEIADSSYRFSTPVDMPPHGFTFNQYLIDADEPLLFHCGGRTECTDRARRDRLLGLA